MLLNVTGREFATILAGLRYWQRKGILGPTKPHCLAEYDIASDAGKVQPLGNLEIDELCERLNFADTPTKTKERQEQLVKYALKFLVANIDETTEEDLNADAATLGKELLDLVSQEEN